MIDDDVRRFWTALNIYIILCVYNSFRNLNH